ncbi:hypothetical protein V2J09_005048 [Rumex salicifolius]
MESSSSASSSSISQYTGALSFSASDGGGGARLPDLPIYESTPHYPRMDNFNAVDAVRFQHGFSLHRPIHPPYFLAPPIPTPQLHDARDLHHHRGSVVSYNGVTTNNSTTGCYGGNYGMMNPNFCHQTGSVIYLGSAAPPPHQRIPVQASSQRDMAMVFDSVPVVVHGAEKAASKRLRLFGVNMDCTDADDEPNHHHHNQNQNDLVLDSDRVSSSSGESGLQLRLSGVDKGKSSIVIKRSRFKKNWHKELVIYIRRLRQTFSSPVVRLHFMLVI